MSIINTIGRFVYNSKILSWFLHLLRGNSYRMLYYHIVSDNNPIYYFKNKGICVKDFMEQIQYFKKHYKFITVGEAVEKKQIGESLKGYMTITTDDGFVENYTTIAPILREENLSATLFLIDKCIDNKHLMWRNKLVYITNTVDSCELNRIILQFAINHNINLPKKSDDILSWSKREFSMRKKEELTDKLWEITGMPPIGEFLMKHKPYMTSDQIKELVDQGFEIAAHGTTHPYLRRSDYEQLEEEVIGSIKGIQEKIGVKVEAFSYPFGSRPNSADEDILIKNHGNKIKALIGIKNILKNDNPYKWERDMQEAKRGIATFRFIILPYLRKIIGRYKLIDSVINKSYNENIC